MSTSGSGPSNGPHRAGLFDIRTIIALLLGIYGIVLVLTSFFTSAAQKAKADGVNVNLYTGIGLLVAAVVFGVWTRLRPIVVGGQEGTREEEREDANG